MMKLQIKILSPVHISTGNSREPFEYAIHNGKIFVLNPEACLNLLYEDDPKNLDKFSEWVSEIQTEIDKLNQKRQKDRRKGLTQEESQKLSLLQKNFQIYYFAESVLNKPDLARKMVTDDRFYSYWGHFTEKVRGKRRLREQIKVKNVPYIPGSSLKGLFRTALLYTLVKKADKTTAENILKFKYQKNSPNSISEIIKDLKDKHDKAYKAVSENNRYHDYIKNLRRAINNYEKRMAQGVESYFLICKNERDEYTDPLYDIFKFVEISDTIPLDVELSMQQLMSFTINRNEKNFNAQPIDITEFIDEDSTFEFYIHIKSSEIIDLLKKSGTISKWKDLSLKLSRILNVSEEELNGYTPREIETRFIEVLLNAIDEYGKDIKNKDLEWLALANQNKVASLQKFYDTLPEGAAKIGFSSGWHAMTVGYAMYNNEHLREIAEQVIYLFHLHLIQKQKNVLLPRNFNRFDSKEWLKVFSIKPNMKYFPGSRRMTGNYSGPSNPVGWIQIGENLVSGKKSSDSNKKDQNLPQNSEEANSDNMEEMLAKLKEKFSG